MDQGMVHRKGLKIWHGSWVILCIAILLASWVPRIVDVWELDRFERNYVFPIEFAANGLHIDNTIEGDPVIVRPKAEILRDATMEYKVQIKTYPGEDTVCTGADKNIPYRKGRTYPEEVTLHWWADDGECSGAVLSAGDFFVRTLFYQQPEHPDMPRQLYIVDSNVFTVEPREDGAFPETNRDLILQQRKQIEVLRNEVRQLRDALLAP
jgi:hypothetical protein